MLKVILVDDEKTITEGLKHVFDWDAAGFSICATAESGEEALVLAVAHKPDILITDIKMGKMSGIELAEQYLQIDKACRVILLSGYQDFGFARKAVSLGVSEYLLKPVDEDELTTALERIKAAITAERSSPDARVQNNGARLFEIRSTHIARLVMGMVDTAELDIAPLGFDDGFAPDAEIFYGCIAVAGYDDANEPETQRLIRHIERKALDGMSQDFKLLALSFIEKEYMLIAFGQDDTDRAKAFRFTESLFLSFRTHKPTFVSAGIGGLTRDVSSLKTAYRQALAALEHSFFSGKPISLFEQDFVRKTPQTHTDHGRELVEAVLFCLDKEANTLLQKQMLYFTETAGLDRRFMYNDCYELCLKFRNLLKDEKIKNIPGKNDLFLRIKENRNLPELKRWMFTHMDEVIQKIRTARLMSEENAVEAAKEYLQKHFSENISLKSLAERVYMSSTYFCSLFKKKTGKGFHDYLLDIRMKEALRMLSTGKYKVNEVAFSVGFNNPRYFSAVFKKRFLINPTDFDVKKHSKLLFDAP